MSLICSLTGHCPEEPVVSPQGYLFDLQAIQAHLTDSAFCPFTRQPLQVNELRLVRPSPLADPLRAGGAIPSMIRSFEVEMAGLLYERVDNEGKLRDVMLELKEVADRIQAGKRVIAKLQAEIAGLC